VSLLSIENIFQNSQEVLSLHKKNMRYLTCFFSVVLLALNACKPSGKIDPTLFENGKSVGVLSNAKIDEASGLDASTANQGKYWTHNDSAGEPRIFLVEQDGAYIGSAILKGVKNRDWEDISVGPGPDDKKTYVYIGEIGDNEAIYPFKYIYRIEEPSLIKGDEVVIDNIDSIKFQFSDGARDAEALFIEPKSKDLYIFSKREKQINLYTLPYPQRTDTILVASYLLTMPVTQITAADYDGDRGELLIKNYDSIYYWKQSEEESILTMLKRKGTTLPYTAEPQGEALCFTLNGGGYLTTSEKKKGIEASMLFYKRITR
jgi:hypothetical protein